jgi:hypothetical protein
MIPSAPGSFKHLQGQEEMNNAVRQSITPELTIGGFERTGSTGHGSDITEIPWNHVYNMVLSTAKILDTTRSKQNGCP